MAEPSGMLHCIVRLQLPESLHPTGAIRCAVDLLHRIFFLDTVSGSMLCSTGFGAHEIGKCCSLASVKPQHVLPVMTQYQELCSAVMANRACCKQCALSSVVKHTMHCPCIPYMVITAAHSI